MTSGAVPLGWGCMPTLCRTCVVIDSSEHKCRDSGITDGCID